MVNAQTVFEDMNLEDSVHLDKYVDDCEVALGVVVDLRFDGKGQSFVVEPLPLFDLRDFFFERLFFYLI